MALLESKGKNCENCDSPIPFPTAANVSHIVTKGNNTFVRSHPLNYFYLCFDCHCIYDKGARSSMRIYPESLRRKQIIIRGYYDEILRKNKGGDSDGELS